MHATLPVVENGHLTQASVLLVVATILKICNFPVNIFTRVTSEYPNGRSCDSAHAFLLLDEQWPHEIVRCLRRYVADSHTVACMTVIHSPAVWKGTRYIYGKLQAILCMCVCVCGVGGGGGGGGGAVPFFTNFCM